jgi:hypothetical protein
LQHPRRVGIRVQRWIEMDSNHPFTFLAI